MKRFIQGFAAQGFFQAVMIGIQLILPPILLSTWGISLYGIWLMLASASFLLSSSDMGYANSAGTEMTIRLAQGDRTGALIIFQSAWLIILTFSGCALFMSLAACWLLPNQYFFSPSEISQWDLRLTLTYLVLAGVIGVQASFFVAVLRADGLVSIAIALNSIIHLSQAVLTAAIALDGGSLAAAALACLLLEILGAISLAFIGFRYVSWLRASLSGVRRSVLRDLLRPSLALAAMPLSQTLVLHGSTLALGVASSPGDAAIFSIARTLTRVGVQCGSLFTIPIAPIFSAAFGRQDSQAQRRILLVILASALIILAPIAIVLLLAGQQIVTTWTRDSIDMPWDTLAIMTGAMFFHGIWFSIAALVVAMNKQQSFTYIYLVAALLSLPLTWALAVPLKTLGGAISMLVVDLVMSAIVLRLAFTLIAPRSELVCEIKASYEYIREKTRQLLRKAG